jgi:lysophospholipase L1-like esterase
MHQHNAWHSAQGIAALVAAIRHAPIEPGMPVPDILVVVPPPIQSAKGPMTQKFEGAWNKCEGLAAAYQQVCTELGCRFFDAGTVTTSSNADGVHLDAEQHMTLGLALAEFVADVVPPCA